MEDVAQSAHSMKLEELLSSLDSSSSGISQKQAKEALEKFGLNEIEKKKEKGFLKMLASQINLIIMLLLVAAALAFVIGDWKDCIGILAAVILSVFFGFFQEYKAEESLKALAKIVAKKATVLRGGKQCKILANEIVPGDVLLLAEGELVPADCRIMDGKGIAIDQSMLTGESVPAEKGEGVLAKKTSLSERTNIVYAGTLIVRGGAKALAFATGKNTEFGKIAKKLEETEEVETHLSKKITQLGGQVAKAAIILTILFFILGILQGRAFADMAITSVALFVAAVPEGLPTVLAITLAIGVQKMAKDKALVRRLQSVETMGSATVICTDKTGTLTQNQMGVACVESMGSRFILSSGKGHRLVLAHGGEKREYERLEKLLSYACLCSDASVQFDAFGAISAKKGDPTEVAMLVAAKRSGIDFESIREKHDEICNFAFEYKRKRMTQVRKFGKTITAYTKGAPEVVLSLCTHYLDGNGRMKKLDAKMKATLTNSFEGYAKQGMRTIAIAYRDVSKMKQYSEQKVEKELVWVGIICLIDPPRPEVKEALALCKKAGIKVVMLTGDSVHTAKAVAKELGLLDGGQTLSGEEIEEMDEKTLRKRIENVFVCARVTPEHKYRIICALQANGEIVAVTGDGVNDAPSIKKADIGVAMGIGGTDVARGASDIVLLDNNFGTLVHAIERGRSIFSNIHSFVRYQFTTNVAALSLMFGAAIVSLPLPLKPLQILWINIIMDGPPALALGMEPARKDAMEMPPRNPQAPFLSKNFAISIVSSGILMMVLTLFVFSAYLSLSPLKAYTMGFTVFVFLQFANALNCRSSKSSIFSKFFANKYLGIALVFSLLAQVAIIYLPVFQSMFGTVGLDSYDWAVILICAAIVVMQEEMKKKFLPKMMEF